MTELLYHTDAYLRECTAVVVGHSSDGNGIVLDRSVLYATSGGQPHDRHSASSRTRPSRTTLMQGYRWSRPDGLDHGDRMLRRSSCTAHGRRGRDCMDGSTCTHAPERSPQGTLRRNAAGIAGGRLSTDAGVPRFGADADLRPLPPARRRNGEGRLRRCGGKLDARRERLSGSCRLPRLAVLRTSTDRRGRESI